ncbi:hypothetical protein ACEPAF_5607 [Sanghuangporus sanghuang]
MNSYPAELLVHLAPVMFVAGLESLKATSPGPSSEQLAAAPGTPASETAVPIAPTPSRANSSDPFVLLVHRLREALGAQRKPAIWVPDEVRKSKTFQIVFADKTIQFPPRKIPDPTSSQPLHSPLSPLHPSSPLHPDGLIAPIWIRKHTTLVPSVFVLFLRLFENPSPPAGPRSPLEPDGPDVVKEREEREKEDRRHDAELAREISERKKSTHERGMKLTVVLLASRRMLDDPTLDGRLTFIRRTSGLDSRAALFVLSPVSPAELSDFVKSIQQALFDPAIEYYTSHSKRVRRKRNRHTQASAPNPYPHGLAPAARALPLRPEGWTVRYEYKMACFAEFRGEEEVALKHYQDAYSTLLSMFGSPTILAPRTKRWAEAKVLADSINIKICKLFLYNAEHSLALSQFNTHVRRFSELSRVWGISEDTYEYWSWIARQYRVFAELLEQATHFGMPIPSHSPSNSTAIPEAGQAQLEIEALPALGINPSTALMHPGFYYYFAAEYTEKRRMRFLRMLEDEASSQGTTQAPGFQNEKKVDHLASILELYTKAYEVFKKYSTAPTTSTQNQTQGRCTLWIAYRIAQTYFDSGKYEMSVRFFERITHTYGREKWSVLLSPLLSTWYACSQQLGDVEMSVRLLVEVIARGCSNESGAHDDEGTVAEDLNAILKSTVPKSNDSLIVDLTETEPLFDCSVSFWTPEIKLGEQVAFQISFNVSPNVVLSGLPIRSLRLYTSDGRPLVKICRNNERGQESKTISCIAVGHLALPLASEKIVESALTFSSGKTIILTGTLSSEVPQEIKFSKAELCISEGAWKIEVPFVLSHRRDVPSTNPKWLSSSSGQPPNFVSLRRANYSSVTVKYRPHQVDVVLLHRTSAYLDERYPISIDVTNNDDRELEFTLDVLLQPGDDGCENRIFIEGEQSSGLIKGISFGTLHPGTTACKTLHLVSSGRAGERMVDVSVQSRTLAPLSDSESDAPAPRVETGEVLQTLVVPTVDAFIVAHEVSYGRRPAMGPGPADLSTFDPEFWDDREGGRAFIKTTFECAECTGASNVIIDSIELDTEVWKVSVSVEVVTLINRQESHYARVIHCSLDHEEFPAEFSPGDQFSIICELCLAPPDDFFEDSDALLNHVGRYCLEWRRLSEEGNPGLSSSTQFSLPDLKPPPGGLVALLDAPPLAHLHQPFMLELSLRNRHPTRSACPMVSLELEPTESFVAAGIRNGRLATLIPGAEEKVVWQLIPLECGPAVLLPKIKVTDRRRATEGPESETGGAPQQPEGLATDDEIQVVDVRWDRRRSDGSCIFSDVSEVQEPKEEGLGAPRNPTISDRRFTILVSPA